MGTSRYRQAKTLSQIKIGRLRKQRPSAGSSPKASFKPTVTTLNAGIWRSFGDGPGGNEPPRAGYRLSKAKADSRITLPYVSILER